MHTVLFLYKKSCTLRRESGIKMCMYRKQLTVASSRYFYRGKKTSLGEGKIEKNLGNNYLETQDCQRSEKTIRTWRFFVLVSLAV